MFTVSALNSVIVSLLAAERQAYFRTFILASIAGIFSLFPLLFTPGGIQLRLRRHFLLIERES
jgi:hypothetical protein